MRLLRLKADGFGVLRGEYHFERDRVALVIDENERGKTSLLHAIVAALYGLDGDARRYRQLVTPLDRWRPWDGGSYRVELDVEARGEHYAIRRDFGRGTAEVWNGRAQNVSHEFASDRDELNVGRALLGLEAEEFAKCAFWRQGELADVVPDQEKDRRQSTLQARLEQAADSLAGDTTAIEAIQALDQALRRYSPRLPEIGADITIDNAIKRLEMKRDELAVERNALAAEYRGLAGPLDRIAVLGAEQAERRSLERRLDAWRLRLRAGDAQRRLERDALRRSEIGTLETEAATLGDPREVPADGAATLAAIAARHDEQQRQLDRLRSARGPIAEAAAKIQAELDPLADVRTGADAADALAARAAELRRLDAETTRLHAERDAALEVMRAGGLSPERAIQVLPRFEKLTPDQRELLREQGRLALTLQGEVALAEQTLAVGRATEQEIARWKRPRYIAGALLIVLGAAVAGAALIGALTLALPLPSWAIPAGGGALATLGLIVMIATAFARRGVRAEAEARIETAEEQLRHAHLSATENETRMQLLGIELGYPGAAAMLDDWAEAQRLRDLHAPVVQAEQRIAAVEHQREATVAEAAATLGTPAVVLSADTLADAAGRVRRRTELEQHVRALAQQLRRIDEEADGHAADAEEQERRAAEVIAAAGLRYAPGRPWSEWTAELARAARRAVRRAEIERERESRGRELLDDATVETLRAEIAHAGAAPPLTASDAEDLALYRTPAEAEAQLAELRGRLDDLRAERDELERQVRAVSDRYHEKHPARAAELEAVEAELERAVRFRDAAKHARATIERVARETHRRWAEFLDERVTELLHDVGSSITRVRFGDDLDFAVTQGDLTSPRGRALHQLSTGARDQLHLAARLAISEFLSRGGEELPLLIDDCFATSDDERTRAGMRMLLDGFSRAHQVVLVTCHRQRYQGLAGRDADLYAERAQWLELRPAFTAV